MRDSEERLYGILEAIGRIERYAARGRDAFDQDELIQVWIVHHLQIIGEAFVVVPKIPCWTRMHKCGGHALGVRRPMTVLKRR